jgi:septum formation topological specificity factor MinE
MVSLVESNVRNSKNKIYRRLKMIIKFMRELKEKVGQNLFKEIISMAEKDINLIDWVEMLEIFTILCNYVMT